MMSHFFLHFLAFNVMQIHKENTPFFPHRKLLLHTRAFIDFRRGACKNIIKTPSCMENRRPALCSQQIGIISHDVRPFIPPALAFRFHLRLNFARRMWCMKNRRADLLAPSRRTYIYTLRKGAMHVNRLLGVAAVKRDWRRKEEHSALFSSDEHWRFCTQHQNEISQLSCVYMQQIKSSSAFYCFRQA